MSTNPNNAVGTNGAFGGRTSVNAFNDVLGVFKSRGIVSGWSIVPDSGMDVSVGGDGSTRDVAIAEDNIGNKTTVNNISQQPVTVSIPAAPAANSRIDLIVAYVDNPAQGVATETDNYGACGLIVVSGASAANPVAPDETDIRTAITTDGGAGSVAYYVVLGSVTVASGTTDISSNMISAGSFAAVTSDNVDYQMYTVPSTLVFASGVTGTHNIRVIKLGGKLAMAIGTPFGYIKANATQQFKITTSTPLFSTIYGYSMTGHQQAQASSYLMYSEALASSTTFIDSFFQCQNTSSATNLYLSYVVFGELAD